LSNKKILSLLLITLLLVSIAFTGCGQQQAAVQQGDSADSADIPAMTITFGHMDATQPDMQNHGTAIFFKERVETLSNGKIKVDVVGGGALGSAADLLEQVRTGQIEITNALTEANLATMWNDLNLLGTPYAFRSTEQMMDVWDSAFGQELKAGILDKIGARVAFVYPNGGLRNFTNSVREIKTPADMKGLKIRVMDSPAHMAIVTALGASPTPIAWTELYTALQTGVVQGQENAVPNILQAKLEEVQKYMCTDGHVGSFDFTLMNEDWYQSLTPAARKVIDQACIETEAFGRRFVSVIADNGIEKLVKAGMIIHYTTPEELALFKEATKDVKELIKTTLMDDPTMMDKFDQALAESDKRLGYVK
jgi:tripartite ATP-independent transporter DctP family solute receptor